MKILQTIIAFTPSTFGGIKNSLHHQAREVVNRGHIVDVCTSNAYSRKKNNDRIGLYEVDGINVTYFQRWHPFSMFLIPSLISHLRENIQQFDIVHLQDFRTFPNVIAYYFATKHNIPYVLSACGSVPWGYSAKAVKKCFFDLLIGKKMLKNASRLIALSDVEAKQYQKLGVPRESIRIISNAIEPNDIPRDISQGRFRKKHNIDETFLISFVGRIHEIKGLGFLLKSFAEVLKKAPSSKLVIAGDDHGDLNTLKKVMRKLHIEDKVLLPGHLSGLDKWSLYFDSDVFVLPSRKEAFGNVVPEAAYCMTPVILTDGCVIADVVKNNGFGEVVPFGDVNGLTSILLKILSDDELKKRMALNGREYVLNNWTWKSIVDSLLGEYSEVVSAKKHKKEN
jgi:glycosyltransferase involved in cell wall biosynthesis